MFARLLTYLLVAASLALGDLQVTSPSGGGSIPNTALSVQLTGGEGMTVLVQVVVGGNEASTSQVVYSNTPAPYNGGAIQVNVPASGGPQLAYAGYYLKITGTPATGSASTAYSSRFSLSGMAGGALPPAIESAGKAAAASGSVPQNQAGVAGPAAGAGGAPASNIAFSLQTGLTKFAPMQQKPGTAITAQNTAPLYPTSAWSIFTTMAPIPSQISTQTPSATYSASSRENTAAAASQPTGDMAKFLARWKD